MKASASETGQRTLHTLNLKRLSNSPLQTLPSEGTAQRSELSEPAHFHQESRLHGYSACALDPTPSSPRGTPLPAGPSHSVTVLSRKPLRNSVRQR